MSPRHCLLLFTTHQCSISVPACQKASNHRQQRQMVLSCVWYNANRATMQERHTKCCIRLCSTDIESCRLYFFLSRGKKRNKVKSVLASKDDSYAKILPVQTLWDCSIVGLLQSYQVTSGSFAFFFHQIQCAEFKWNSLLRNFDTFRVYLELKLSCV